MRFLCCKSFYFLLVISLLAGCQSSRPDVDFRPSKDHLHQNSSIPDIQQNIPAIQDKLIQVPRPKAASRANDVYTLSVSSAPIKDVLFKLARDAQLDIDILDAVDALVTINAVDLPLNVILERLSEQTGFRMSIEGKRLVVQADRPYWVNYPIDYVNLDRYTQSSVLLANAVGRTTSQTSSQVTLGSATAVTQGSPLQPGSNVAILNRSQNEMWGTLNQGIMRILRALYPMLSAPLVAGEKEQASSTSASTAPTTAATTDINQLPAPEQPLISGTPLTAYSPYPQDSPVSNYVNIAREAGFVAVYAPSRAHREVQKYIDQLMSGGRRQVLIEATIVEVDLNDESQAGINWSALTSDGTFSYGQTFTGTNNVLQSTAGLATINASSLGRDFSLGSTLKLLERFGNSKVLSSPKIVGLNNQPTLLKVVKNVVFFTTTATPPVYQNGILTTPTTYSTLPNTVPVGLVLTLLPSINDFNEITLVVRPTISSIVDEIEDPNPIFKDRELTSPISSKVPVIQEREMESVLKLNDGQVAILGGLIQDKVGGEDTGVPGLVGQPTLGYLFGQKNKTKSKSELVIFLKPVLVKHPDVEQGSFADKKHLLPNYNRNGYFQ